jgi:hypothetical protein
MIRCPTTSDIAWTGLATARPSLSHLDPRSVFSFDCPVCNGQHQWSKADAWLDDDEEPAAELDQTPASTAPTAVD